MEATVLRLQSLSLVRIAPAEALTNWRRLTVEDTPEMWSVPIVAMAIWWLICEVDENGNIVRGWSHDFKASPRKPTRTSRGCDKGEEIP